MDLIPKTDKLFLILHRAGWSISVTGLASGSGFVFGFSSPTRNQKQSLTPPPQETTNKV